MRIHSNLITGEDIYKAAATARADIEMTRHGSRKRDGAFEVKLTGESKRRPNSGHRGADSDEFAATWDQWGVFLQILFDLDPEMVTPYYDDRANYIWRTNARFVKIGGGWDNYRPKDAHGDHTFRYNGTSGQQECTKCSAVQRWA